VGGERPVGGRVRASSRAFGVGTPVLDEPAQAPGAPQFLRLVAKASAAPPAPTTASTLVLEVGRARVLVAPGFDPSLLRDVVRALGEAGR
jgi:hypothetical protein